jgi:hypothetical protein
LYSVRGILSANLTQYLGQYGSVGGNSGLVGNTNLIPIVSGCLGGAGGGGCNTSVAANGGNIQLSSSITGQEYFANTPVAQGGTISTVGDTGSPGYISYGTSGIVNRLNLFVTGGSGGGGDGGAGAGQGGAGAPGCGGGGSGATLNANAARGGDGGDGFVYIISF